ncbi:hypothetical protein Tco_0482298 [Tanacetum coccineum]
MEEREKDKVKSKSKSNPDKVKGQSQSQNRRNVKWAHPYTSNGPGIGEQERLMAKIALGFYLTQETYMLEALSEETQEGAQDLRTLSIKIGLE